MYLRPITSVPEAIVQDGVPVFGSFNEPFRRLDIRNVKRPYGNLPVPSFLSNMRIRGNLSFFFLFGKYIGVIEICDVKLFGFCEVTFWDQKTGQKLAYRRLAGPFRIQLPYSMENAVCACRSQKRHIRISWNTAKKQVNVTVHLHGDKIRSQVKADLVLNWAEGKSGLLSSVIPIDIKRRCLASLQISAQVSGSFIVNDEGYQTVHGLGLFDIRRAYSKLRTKASRVTGMGQIEGRNIYFRLFSPSSPDEYRYNENVLFVDGAVWPMPPVKITRPYGIDGVWIIQDTESMVDLTFTPVSDNKRKMSLFIVRTEYHTVYGTFEGFVLGGNGEKILLKSFAGIGKKLVLRM